VKSFDVIILGAGIIGLSLARDLRRHSLEVLLLERGEPGREASYAAGGMLAPSGDDIPSSLMPLALASAQMYPEFVNEVEDESGMKVDLRRQGSITFPPSREIHHHLPADAASISPAELKNLEPQVAERAGAYFFAEQSVDPRALSAALQRAVLHRGVEIVSGSAATKIEAEVPGNHSVRVHSSRAQYAASVVVNCCGAWSSEVFPFGFPVRPVKGQMLCVAAPKHNFLQHVVRAPEVYLIPRSDGRILIGATVEEAGFDKRVDPAVIQKLRQAAVELAPGLAEARMLEAWTGLRPGTPDGLPIMGVTAAAKVFVSTGHYRNGILLAPASARVMGQVVRGDKPDCDLSAFSPARFSP
jgi:glycine oxidase